MPRAKSSKNRRMCVINVTVLTGDELKLKVQEQSTVHEVKCLIRQYWQVPLECQTLVVGDMTPEDHEHLCTRSAANSCQDGATRPKKILRDGEGADPPLLVTLLISCHEQQARLAVLEALHTLSVSGSCSRPRMATHCSSMKFPHLIRNAVFACLEDPSSQVKARATNVLHMVAEKDNDEVLTSLLACLSDPNYAVVFGVIRAIPSFVDVGNEFAIDAILAHLQERDRMFEHSSCTIDASPAWEILPQLATKDDQKVVCTVLLLKNAKANVLRMIPNLATATSGHVLEVILEYIQDGLSNVRSTALLVLPQFIHGEDHRVTNAVLQCLGDPHEFVRLMAATALPQIEHENKELVVAALLGKLKDPDKRVVTQVLEALPKYMEMADARLINEIGILLKDPDLRVKKLAKSVLDKMCIAMGRHDLLARNVVVESEIGKASSKTTFNRKDRRKLVLGCDDMCDTSEEWLSEFSDAEEEQCAW